MLLSSLLLITLTKIDQIFQKSEFLTLQALKVCSGRELNPGCLKSNYSLYKVAQSVASNPKCLGFFVTTNFQSPQVCNHLSWNFEILSSYNSNQCLLGSGIPIV